MNNNNGVIQQHKKTIIWLVVLLSAFLVSVWSGMADVIVLLSFIMFIVMVIAIYAILIQYSWSGEFLHYHTLTFLLPIFPAILLSATANGLGEGYIDEYFPFQLVGIIGTAFLLIFVGFDGIVHAKNSITSKRLEERLQAEFGDNEYKKSIARRLMRSNPNQPIPISAIYDIIAGDEEEKRIEREFEQRLRLKQKTPTDKELTKEEVFQIGFDGEKRVNFALDMLRDFEGYKIYYDFDLVAHNGFHQQIDHLAVGKNGIFHLETKTFKGQYKIDTDGNWLKFFRGQWEQKDNPASQSDRHEMVIRDVLKNIIPEEMPINHIIALGTENVSDIFIDGKENSKYPIVHHKDLTTYIKEFHSEHTLTDEQIITIYTQIKKHSRKNNNVKAN